VEDLLAASQGDLPDLDDSFSHDEETATRLTFLEECVAGAKSPDHTPAGQVTELARGK
jgi:hypothetical protein